MRWCVACCYSINGHVMRHFISVYQFSMHFPRMSHNLLDISCFCLKLCWSGGAALSAGAAFICAVCGSDSIAHARYSPTTELHGEQHTFHVFCGSDAKHQQNISWFKTLGTCTIIGPYLHVKYNIWTILSRHMNWHFATPWCMIACKCHQSAWNRSNIASNEQPATVIRMITATT